MKMLAFKVSQFLRTMVTQTFSLWVMFILCGLYRPTTTLSLATHYRVVLYLGTASVKVIQEDPEKMVVLMDAGLFEAEYRPHLLAFKYAIEKMNLQQQVGPNRLIIYSEGNPEAHDSFSANREVCKQMKEGIAAVFGPITKIPRAHVQSICNSFDIPHLQAQWDSRDPRDYYSISVYPDYLVLSKAYADLIRYWGWKKFTVIYEDNDSLIRLQEVLKATRGRDYRVTVRKLDTYQTGYISMFKDLKEKNEYHIIVDCDVSKVKSVLHEALKVNMLSEYYHFHFTTLDLALVDLEDYKYGGANITAMRLIDPSKPLVREVMTDWEISEKQGHVSPLMGQKEVVTDVALMYDAVLLFTKALTQLAGTIKTEQLSCNKRSTWANGNSLLNYMKSMAIEGLSGDVRFENGKRVEFTLDIVELTQEGLKTVGQWEPLAGINITTSHKDRQQQDLSKLANKTLRVVTVFDDPYVMKVEKVKEGGKLYEGFIVDLLDLISQKLGFNYTIYEVHDKTYGSRQSNGKWNGLVGELMLRDPQQRADLAAGGMTITYDREKVVDFTKPFLNLGITIVYKKPQKSPPKLFSFLSPLSIDVWIYMLAAYLCVSFMLFVIARFSPYEWTNPHPCNEDSDIVENQFTILNSLWFTIGSLMQQGCEIAPRAISSRMVACIWWFFTLIMISSYTANLAAFLTVERMESPIEGVEDLAKQTSIKYGTLKSGSTRDFFAVRSDIAPRGMPGRLLASAWYLFTLILVSSYTANLAAFLTVEDFFSPFNSVNELASQTNIKYGTVRAGSTMAFFENSEHPIYKQMWSFMSSNEAASFVNNSSQGFERALSQDFAYLAESATIDYKVQRLCTLTQIGGLLDSKGFGLATPKDSPWREYISNEIIFFQETQMIQKLYTKWWKEKSGGKCVENVKKDASALGVKNVGGVFVVLIGGLVAGLFLACLEFMWKARKNARIDKQSFCSEISEELRFAVRCFKTSNKSKRRNSSKEVIDNGMQFAPLTGIPNNRNQKELYA